MEIEEPPTTDIDQLRPWSISQLREVRYEHHTSKIYAPAAGMHQRIYGFENGMIAELSLRRTTGLIWPGSISELVWIQASDEHAEEIYLGIDSAYIYERSGMLVNPRIVSANNPTTVPVQEILEALLLEIEPLLGFESGGLMTFEQLPMTWREHAIQDYIALDLRKRCKLVILAKSTVLNRLEIQARNYCEDYWRHHASMGRMIRVHLLIGIYPVKKAWAVEEFADLDVGDLLTIQQHQTSEDGSIGLRGFLRVPGRSRRQHMHEVKILMNNDETTLRFASDSPSSQESTLEMQVPSHEWIELEIQAGHTRIPFSDLCAVQAGTLIELSEHNMPMVMLCVNGSPLLEGELVMFKDQLMVQVIKRLE